MGGHGRAQGSAPAFHHFCAPRPPAPATSPEASKIGTKAQAKSHKRRNRERLYIACGRRNGKGAFCRFFGPACFVKLTKRPIAPPHDQKRGGRRPKQKGFAENAMREARAAGKSQIAAKTTRGPLVPQIAPPRSQAYFVRAELRTRGEMGCQGASQRRHRSDVAQQRRNGTIGRRKMPSPS